MACAVLFQTTSNTLYTILSNICERERVCEMATLVLQSRSQEPSFNSWKGGRCVLKKTLHVKNCVRLLRHQSRGIPSTCSGKVDCWREKTNVWDNHLITMNKLLSQVVHQEIAKWFFSDDRKVPSIHVVSI